MCVETMDTRSKHIQTDCQRKAMKPGSKLRWRVLRVSTEQDEALKHCRASAVRATVRKYLRREHRRTQLAKLARALGNQEKGESVCEEMPAAACMHSYQQGAMAPQNTTQYLMGRVYEDMKTNNMETLPASRETSAHVYGEALSPRSVYNALDYDYEACLTFQQRDFEEAFGLSCGALDGARPVGSAPEPCVAPPRGTNRTHLSSGLATDCEIQVNPARTNGPAGTEEQETKEVSLRLNDAR